MDELFSDWLAEEYEDDAEVAYERDDMQAAFEAGYRARGATLCTSGTRAVRQTSRI
jgi:hypothetical protein